MCPLEPAWWTPSRKVLLLREHCARAAAMSAWLGRARPASESLPPLEQVATRWCWLCAPQILGVLPLPPPEASAQPVLKRAYLFRAACLGRWEGRLTGGRGAHMSPPGNHIPPGYSAASSLAVPRPRHFSARLPHPTKGPCGPRSRLGTLPAPETTASANTERISSPHTARRFSAHFSRHVRPTSK